MSFQGSRERESRQMARNNSEMATVISPGENIAALGTGEYRDIKLVGPYGIRWNPKIGTTVQLLKNWRTGGNMSALGSISEGEVRPGELELFTEKSSLFLYEDGTVNIENESGANIKLDMDGSVLINKHFKINPDGTTERI